MMQAVGGKNLTLGNFTTALIIGLAVIGFDFLAGRLKRARLVAVVSGICIALLVLIWVGFRIGLTGFPAMALALSFFVFADLYSVLGVTLFWSFCHDIFTPAEGKRLYGVIGGGGALGGIVGGVIAGSLSLHPLVGTANLPLVAVLPIALTVLLAFFIERRFMSSPDSSGPSAPRAETPKSAGGLEGLRLIAGSRYLQAMVGLLGAFLFGSLIVETQFNLTVEECIKDTDERSSFMGFRDTQMTIFQFLSQVLLTGFLVRNLGLLGGLLVLPIGDLMMGILFVSSPTLAMANLAKIYDGAMKFGMNQVTKEMLYLPTPESTKYRAKAFVDVFFHRIAKGAAAGLIWVFTNNLGFSRTGLFQPLIATVLVWVWLVFLIDRLYRSTVTRRLVELFENGDQPGRPPEWNEAVSRLRSAITPDVPDRTEIRVAVLGLLGAGCLEPRMFGVLSRAFAADLREGFPLAVEWLSLNLPAEFRPLVRLLESSIPPRDQREPLVAKLAAR